MPNELFLVIFSYLKPDEIIQGFRNLNQRFQSLVYPFARHPVLFTDSQSSWIKKYMLLISDDIETIKLSLTHITTVFCGGNSYPNLRSVTIYLTIEWEVELNIENESPLGTIISALKVLTKCSFERVQSDLSYSTDLDYRPCSAIRRVTILGCNEENISNLYALAPELTYLKVWLRSSRTSAYHSTPVIAQFIPLTHLVELNINVIDLKSFEKMKLFINHSQTSFRQLTLNLGQDLMIDGKDLEKLLVSHTSLKNFSFISQLSKEKVNVSDLLQTFQSEWWLNTQRPPVLIHETDFDAILVASIPCSFSNIFENFQFSSNLHSWHFNKENLDSRLIRFTKIRKICLSNKQPINLEFLQLFAATFCSEKQILECNRWGLISEHELFKQVSFFYFFQSYLTVELFIVHEQINYWTNIA